jgi:hypothetical protein
MIPKEMERPDHSALISVSHYQHQLTHLAEKNTFVHSITCTLEKCKGSKLSFQ